MILLAQNSALMALHEIPGGSAARYQEQGYASSHLSLLDEGIETNSPEHAGERPALFQGQAPLDIEAGLNARPQYKFTPAAVYVSVASYRALTPRLAGLRIYASLRHSLLHSLAAICNRAGCPTTERGGSRLVRTILDGGRAVQSLFVLDSQTLQSPVGGSLPSLRLKAILLWAKSLSSFRFMAGCHTRKPHRMERLGRRFHSDKPVGLSAPDSGLWGDLRTPALAVCFACVSAVSVLRLQD